MKIKDVIAEKCWRKQNNELIMKIFGNLDHMSSFTIMSSDFPQGLLEVQYLLGVFFIHLQKTIDHPTKRPTKICLKDKNGGRREKQWDRKTLKSKKLSAKVLSFV